MKAKQEINGNQISNWQMVILFFSVYVILALFVDTVFKLDDDISELLNIIDNAVCLLFLGDFFWRLSVATNKGEFLRWGWIDFISSIPNFEIFRWGRIARIIRILRILRGVRSAKVIISFLFANRTKGTFFSVAMISFVLVVFGSIAILQSERGVEGSNIQNASDALWWSFVTITTVGYGDFYPVTTLGKVVAVLLMTAGVGLFGTFTAYVASMFFEEAEREEKEREKQILQELQKISEKIELLESKISNL